MRKFLINFFALLIFATGAMAQTALPTSWNFSTPSVSNPPNGWTYGIGLNGTGGLTYSTAVNSVGGDNTSARLDASSEFVKIWFADKPGPVSYYIKGTGIPPAAAFTGTFNVQESVDDVTYTDLRVFSTGSPIPGGTMGAANKFIENPAPTTRYIRFFYTEKQSGTNVALDSVLIKAAPASASATINVKIGANTVVNQSLYVVGTTASTNFIIQNTGTTLDLTIDSVRISGSEASDFTIPSVPTSVGPNSSQNLGVNFAPSSNGSRLATIKIYSNDSLKNPYIIQLYGIGGLLASEPASSPATLTLSNPTSFGFKVALSSANPPSEKYLILRQLGSAITQIPVDSKTYKVGDNINGAVVAYVGDSLITNYKPTYIFANSTYHFAAFSFNGPTGFENYLTLNPTASSIQTLGKQPGNYYSGINPNATSFVLDLRNKINPHDTIFYGSYGPRLVSGYVTRDTSGGLKVVNCVYTGLTQIYDGNFNWWTGQGGNPAVLTREHTFAQSWMPSNGGPRSNWPNATNGKEFPEYNDMHNLFPAHQTNANARRSNNPFGIVVNATYTSPTGVGKVGTNPSSGTQIIYEPRDQHKGDAARALMYMSVCYNGISGRNWSFPSYQSPAVLMQWHQQDPPSDFEIARHEFIFGLQKNRNPFIDNPEWANSINFANMTFLSTSVEKLTFENSVLTYPNPAKDRIFVDATLIFNSGMKYELVNLAGSVLQNGVLADSQTSLELPIKSGIYLLKLKSNKGTFVTKIIKD